MSRARRVLPAVSSEVLLVAVVVFGTVIVALILFPLAESTDSGPIAVVDATAQEGDLVLAHRDGATAPVTDLEVVFDGPEGRQVRVPFELGTAVRGDGQRFAAGDRWRFESPFAARAVRVRLRHEPSSSTMLDERLDFSGGGGPIVTERAENGTTAPAVAPGL